MLLCAWYSSIRSSRSTRLARAPSLDLVIMDRCSGPSTTSSSRKTAKECTDDEAKQEHANHNTHGDNGVPMMI